MSFGSAKEKVIVLRTDYEMETMFPLSTTGDCIDWNAAFAEARKRAEAWADETERKSDTSLLFGDMLDGLAKGTFRFC